MKFLLILTLIFLFGCETEKLSDYYSEDQIPEQVAKSREVIAERLIALESIDNHDKALNFEHIILSRLHPVHKFCPKIYQDGRPGELRMDMTALFLASLAFKYAVTQDLDDKENIISILDSIYLADEKNDLDGFIPYKVAITDDELQITRNDTHINVYSQLLFAYITLLKFSNDREIEDKIINHFELIIGHLESTDFVLTDNEGQEVEYSDLSPSRFSLQRNRQQMLLLLVDWSLKFLNDDLSSLRQRLSDMNYEKKIQTLHIQLFRQEIPTHSSSWLNLMNSYIGYHIDNQDYYKTAFENLYARYEDEQNVMFMLMLLSLSDPDDTYEEALSSINDRLSEFPASPDNKEIINSRDPEVDLKRRPNYVKLKREVETVSPLSFYRRPMRSFEWKLNQMRVDGNFTSPGTYQYTGIDYLIAYWMMRWQLTRID